MGAFQMHKQVVNGSVLFCYARIHSVETYTFLNNKRTRAAAEWIIYIRQLLLARFPCTWIETIVGDKWVASATSHEPSSIFQSRKVEGQKCIWNMYSKWGLSRRRFHSANETLEPETFFFCSSRRLGRLNIWRNSTGPCLGTDASSNNFQATPSCRCIDAHTDTPACPKRLIIHWYLVGASERSGFWWCQGRVVKTFWFVFASRKIEQFQYLVLTWLLSKMHQSLVMHDKTQWSDDI